MDVDSLITYFLNPHIHADSETTELESQLSQSHIDYTSFCRKYALNFTKDSSGSKVDRRMFYIPQNPEMIANTSQKQHRKVRADILESVCQVPTPYDNGIYGETIKEEIENCGFLRCSLEDTRVELLAYFIRQRDRLMMEKAIVMSRMSRFVRDALVWARISPLVIQRFDEIQNELEMTEVRINRLQPFASTDSLAPLEGPVAVSSSGARLYSTNMTVGERGTTCIFLADIVVRTKKFLNEMRTNYTTSIFLRHLRYLSLSHSTQVAFRAMRFVSLMHSATPPTVEDAFTDGLRVRLCSLTRSAQAFSELPLTLIDRQVADMLLAEFARTFEINIPIHIDNGGALAHQVETEFANSFQRALTLSRLHAYLFDDMGIPLSSKGDKNMKIQKLLTQKLRASNSSIDKITSDGEFSSPSDDEDEELQAEVSVATASGGAKAPRTPGEILLKVKVYIKPSTWLPFISYTPKVPEWQFEQYTIIKRGNAVPVRSRTGENTQQGPHATDLNRPPPSNVERIKQASREAMGDYATDHFTEETTVRGETPNIDGLLKCEIAFLDCDDSELVMTRMQQLSVEHAKRALRIQQQHRKGVLGIDDDNTPDVASDTKNNLNITSTSPVPPEPLPKNMNSTSSQSPKTARISSKKDHTRHKLLSYDIDTENPLGISGGAHENDMISSPYALSPKILSALYLLQHLRMRHLKRKLLTLLNYFRHVQRHLAVDVHAQLLASASEAAAVGGVSLLSDRVAVGEVLDWTMLQKLHSTKLKAQQMATMHESEIKSDLPTNFEAHSGGEDSAQKLMSAVYNHCNPSPALPTISGIFKCPADSPMPIGVSAPAKRDAELLGLETAEMVRDTEILIRDEHGIPIIHAVALDDLNEMMEELLSLGSYYINRFESCSGSGPILFPPSRTSSQDLSRATLAAAVAGSQPSVELGSQTNSLRARAAAEETLARDGGTTEPVVDRAAVLLDLLEAEVGFQDAKRRLMDIFREALEHAIDPLERRAIGQHLTDLMALRPRFDLEGSTLAPMHPSTCYTASICALDARRATLRQILDYQISASIAEANNEMNTTVGANASTAIRDSARQSAAQMSKIIADATKMVLNTDKNEDAAKRSIDTDAINAIPSEGGESQLHRPEHAEAPRKASQLNIQAWSARLNEGGPRDLIDCESRGVSELNLVSDGIPIGLLDIHESACLVLRADLIAQEAIAELIKNYAPSSELEATAMERSFYQVASMLWRDVRVTSNHLSPFSERTNTVLQSSRPEGHLNDALISKKIFGAVGGTSGESISTLKDLNPYEPLEPILNLSDNQIFAATAETAEFVFKDFKASLRSRNISSSAGNNVLQNGNPDVFRYGLSVDAEEQLKGEEMIFEASVSEELRDFKRLSHVDGTLSVYATLLEQLRIRHELSGKCLESSIIERLGVKQVFSVSSTGGHSPTQTTMAAMPFQLELAGHLTAAGCLAVADNTDPTAGATVQIVSNCKWMNALKTLNLLGPAATPGRSAGELGSFESPGLMGMRPQFELFPFGPPLAARIDSEILKGLCESPIKSIQLNCAPNRLIEMRHALQLQVAHFWNVSLVAHRNSIILAELGRACVRSEARGSFTRGSIRFLVPPPLNAQSLVDGIDISPSPDPAATAVLHQLRRFASAAQAVGLLQRIELSRSDQHALHNARSQAGVQFGEAKALNADGKVSAAILMRDSPFTTYAKSVAAREVAAEEKIKRDVRSRMRAVEMPGAWLADLRGAIESLWRERLPSFMRSLVIGGQVPSPIIFQRAMRIIRNRMVAAVAYGLGARASGQGLILQLMETDRAIRQLNQQLPIDVTPYWNPNTLSAKSGGDNDDGLDIATISNGDKSQTSNSAAVIHKLANRYNNAILKDYACTAFISDVASIPINSGLVLTDYSVPHPFRILGAEHTSRLRGLRSFHELIELIRAAEARFPPSPSFEELGGNSSNRTRQMTEAMRSVNKNDAGLLQAAASPARPSQEVKGSALGRSLYVGEILLMQRIVAEYDPRTLGTLRLMQAGFALTSIYVFQALCDAEGVAVAMLYRFGRSGGGFTWHSALNLGLSNGATSEMNVGMTVADTFDDPAVPRFLHSAAEALLPLKATFRKLASECLSVSGGQSEENSCFRLHRFLSGYASCQFWKLQTAIYSCIESCLNSDNTKDAFRFYILMRRLNNGAFGLPRSSIRTTLNFGSLTPALLGFEKQTLPEVLDHPGSDTIISEINYESLRRDSVTYQNSKMKTKSDPWTLRPVSSILIDPAIVLGDLPAIGFSSVTHENNLPGNTLGNIEKTSSFLQNGLVQPEAQVSVDFPRPVSRLLARIQNTKKKPLTKQPIVSARADLNTSSSQIVKIVTARDPDHQSQIHVLSMLAQETNPLPLPAYDIMNSEGCSEIYVAYFHPGICLHKTAVGSAELLNDQSTSNSGNIMMNTASLKAQQAVHNARMKASQPLGIRRLHGLSSAWESKSRGERKINSLEVPYLHPFVRRMLADYIPEQFVDLQYTYGHSAALLRVDPSKELTENSKSNITSKRTRNSVSGENMLESGTLVGIQNASLKHQVLKEESESRSDSTYNSPLLAIPKYSPQQVARFETFGGIDTFTCRSRLSLSAEGCHNKLVPLEGLMNQLIDLSPPRRQQLASVILELEIRFADHARSRGLFPAVSSPWARLQAEETLSKACFVHRKLKWLVASLLTRLPHPTNKREYQTHLAAYREALSVSKTDIDAFILRHVSVFKNPSTSSEIGFNIEETVSPMEHSPSPAALATVLVNCIPEMELKRQTDLAQFELASMMMQIGRSISVLDKIILGYSVASIKSEISVVSSLIRTESELRTMSTGHTNSDAANLSDGANLSFESRQELEARTIHSSCLEIIDKRPFISKVDIAIQFVNRLRSRGTFVRTANGERGYVFSEKDLNECVEDLGRRLLIWGSSFVASKAQTNDGVVNILLKRLASEQLVRSRLKLAHRTLMNRIEARVNTEVCSKGFQLVFEVDRLRRIVRDVQTEAIESDRRARAEARQEAETEIATLKAQVAEIGGRFESFKEALSGDLQNAISQVHKSSVDKLLDLADSLLKRGVLKPDSTKMRFNADKVSSRRLHSPESNISAGGIDIARKQFHDRIRAAQEMNSEYEVVEKQRNSSLTNNSLQKNVDEGEETIADSLLNAARLHVNAIRHGFSGEDSENLNQTNLLTGKPYNLVNSLNSGVKSANDAIESLDSPYKLNKKFDAEGIPIFSDFPPPPLSPSSSRSGIKPNQSGANSPVGISSPLIRSSAAPEWIDLIKTPKPEEEIEELGLSPNARKSIGIPLNSPPRKSLSPHMSPSSPIFASRKSSTFISPENAVLKSSLISDGTKALLTQLAENEELESIQLRTIIRDMSVAMAKLKSLHAWRANALRTRLQREISSIRSRLSKIQTLWDRLQESKTREQSARLEAQRASLEASHVRAELETSRTRLEHVSGKCRKLVAARDARNKRREQLEARLDQLEILEGLDVAKLLLDLQAKEKRINELEKSKSSLYATPATHVLPVTPASISKFDQASNAGSLTHNYNTTIKPIYPGSPTLANGVGLQVVEALPGQVPQGAVPLRQAFERLAKENAELRRQLKKEKGIKQAAMDKLNLFRAELTHVQSQK